MGAGGMCQVKEEKRGVPHVGSVLLAGSKLKAERLCVEGLESVSATERDEERLLVSLPLVESSP